MRPDTNEIRNPKSEGRRPKGWLGQHINSSVRLSGWFRISDFGFRISCCCLALAAATAQSQTHAPAKAPGAPPAASNAAPAEPPVPQSVFVIPHAPPEGKDPFFPHSIRVYGSLAARPSQPAAVAELRLNGFSGPPDHRLAIINYRTFETSEEAEVNTSAGRVRIRCLEIKAESVVVQFVIGGERRELRMRQGA